MKRFSAQELLSDKKNTRKTLVDEVVELYGIIEELKLVNLRTSDADFWREENKRSNREIKRLKSVIVEITAKIAFGDIK